MDDPTVKQLRYAVAVADHQHFGRAAEAMFVSQPGLSEQVRELERRLGVVLFERGRHGARLTAAGTEVIEATRAVLRRLDDLRRLASSHEGTVRGPVRLSAIPTIAPYLLPAVVGVLRTRWPEARFELDELQTDDVLAGLDDGSIDLGLLAVPYDTGALTVETVREDPFRLAIASTHPLAAASDPLPLTVLADLDVLLLEDGHCLRKHAQRACAIAGSVAQRDVRSASLSTLTQMVAGGEAATLLPETALAVEARPGNGIATRPFTEPEPGRTIAIAWRPSDPRAALYRTAVAAIVERLDEPAG
ncbi:MAG: LysR substrate-binding domain-containing protein [Actinomycetota bacterium]